MALWVGISLDARAQSEFSEPECGSFIILGAHSTADLHYKALSIASLEGYRLRNSNRIIEFEDGVTFNLLSANDLQACGQQISIDSYSLSSELDPAVKVIFKLCGNGQITARSEIDPRSKLAKIGAGFPAHERTVIQKSEFDQMIESKQAIILANPHQYKIE